MKVLILGTTGMLGSMIAKVFRRETDFKILGTVSNEESLKCAPGNIPTSIMDVWKDQNELLKTVDRADYIVNAIGVIKPYIHDNNPLEIEKAIRVNALFPHFLATVAAMADTKVLQIATDCVYQGTKMSPYHENDLHDALDVYGKTKSLGEVYSPQVSHLRCSIIGPELKNKVSLLEWFLSLPQNAPIKGFSNHLWNGITTLHYARICKAIIQDNIEIDHIQHIMPNDFVTKYGLLKIFKNAYSRDDIEIMETEAAQTVDRRLTSNNSAINSWLWEAAGYSRPPSIEEMVKEMAAYL